MTLVPKRKDRVLAVGHIEPHPVVQRAFDRKHTAKIAKDLDMQSLGVISVLETMDGQFLSFDGQHRVAAVLDVHGPTQKIPCHLYLDPGLPKIELTRWCAEMAHRLNAGSKSWQPIDRFLNEVVAQHEDAVEITKILKQYDLMVVNEGRDGAIRAVSACQNIYKDGSDTLFNETLSVLHDAWGRDRDAYNQILLNGMAVFIKLYRDKANLKRVSEILAKSGTAAEYIGKCRNQGRISNMTASKAFSWLIVWAYNKKRSRNRLPLPVEV